MDPYDYQDDIPDYDPIVGIRDYAASPHEPQYWQYDGYQNGGHEFVCANAFEYYRDVYDIRFHVHRQDGNPPWTFGSMWAPGISNTAVNINDEVTDRSRLTEVVKAFYGDLGLA